MGGSTKVPPADGWPLTTIMTWCRACLTSAAWWGCWCALQY